VQRTSPIFLALALLLASMVTALAAQTAEPRRYAIIVGINQYSDPGLVSLAKAQNDAGDLAAALKRLGGYRVISLMTGDKAYSDAFFPSKAKIIGQVEAMADSLGPDDQVLFFFSGHGVNDAKTGDSYLLPIDVQAKDPVASGVNLQKDILVKFTNAGVRHVVALVDACQKTVYKDKGMRPTGVDQVRTVSDAVVITATGAGKASYEDPQGSNGLFTKGILAALQGEADANRDGVVSVEELEQFLPRTVADYALASGISQKPAVFDMGSGAKQPPLVRVALARPAGNGGNGSGSQGTGAAGANGSSPAAPTAKAQFVQFKLPPEVVATIRILDVTGRELQTIADTTGASPRLEPGSYKVVVQDRLYQYYEYEKTIMVADAKQTVSLDLKPNFGSLKLGSDPADGVEVLINGEKKGTISGGSLQIDKIKSGSYTVVLSKDLYETKSQAIQIEDGKTASVSVKLAANFFTLSLAVVAGQTATVYVDGQVKGNLPQTLNLPFRDVALRVVPADGRYQEWTRTLSPKAKGSLEKPTVSFAPRQGSLVASTLPDSEAELTLTPVGGGSAIKIGSAPTDWTGLVGDYTLSASVSLNGQPWSGSQSITLREGQETVVSLQLSDAGPKTGNLTLTTKAGGTLKVGSQSFSITGAGSWNLNDLPAGELVLGMTYADGQSETVKVSLSRGGQASAALNYAPKGPADGQSQTTSLGLQMRAIPGGSFTMGDTAGGGWDGEIKHQVTLSGFYLGQTEVTQAQYKTVMGYNPSKFKSGSDAPNRPVEQVSWYDAVEFCNKLSQAEGKSPAYTISGTKVTLNSGTNGYRLPTEAQWEYAAKGGAQTPVQTVKYAGSASLDEVAWYEENSYKKGSSSPDYGTHPVAQKKANGLGLYDMSGNVWEWCWDWKGDYSTSAQTDPAGPASGTDRVLRGGSWNGSAGGARLSYRNSNTPDYRNFNGGFRVVLPAVQK
jgi:formylglycine-generating enzyme required for sulfatase activity